MKLTESLIDELIKEILSEEGEEEQQAATQEAPPEEDPAAAAQDPAAAAAAQTPPDLETDFQELPIDIPDSPFKKKVKESKIKLKNLISENFWNQVAQMKGWEAPPKEKRWSKSMNDGLGHLTEFEANKGGKDYIKEVGAAPLYKKHISFFFQTFIVK